jgi:glycosyltransferase involved in cell wall biosynthesis
LITKEDLAMNLNKETQRVAVLYHRIPQYRVDFFNVARQRFSELNIDFLLLYGQPGSLDAQNVKSVDISWATKIPNIIWQIGNRELYWQPVLGHLKNVDLIIVESSNTLLVNYILLLQNMLGIRKVAYWGHGRNFQAKKGDRLSEWLKRILSTKVHWYFAYNDLSAQYLKSIGYPINKITSVQNAVDTHNLTRAFHNLNETDLLTLRQNLGICGQNVCIYTGGMYPEKRIGFLLESLILIRKQIPDFEMIFVGSGVDAGLVQSFASSHNWVHYVGPKFNLEKVPYFAISKLFLIPGLVGLGILDSFALETPLVTTNISYHSPEIAYLENGVNGIMVDESQDPQAYAKSVVDLLTDEARRQELIVNCRKAREEYTIENMVENFVKGVKQALEV